MVNLYVFSYGFYLEPYGRYPTTVGLRQPVKKTTSFWLSLSKPIHPLTHSLVDLLSATLSDYPENPPPPLVPPPVLPESSGSVGPSVTPLSEVTNEAKSRLALANLICSYSAFISEVGR